MKKKMILGFCLWVPALLLLSACAVTVGSKTVGVRSGEFIYTEGYLRAIYTFPLEQVWQASEKALADMKATDIERSKKISEGTLQAMIQDERVRIDVIYTDREGTMVAVLTGTAGSTLASQLIHDRILGILRTR